MKIKEISRVDLGFPCNLDIIKCPYFKDGIDYDGNKLNCSETYGVRCNGRIFRVIYEIDGKKYRVIEKEEFSRPLDEEIDVDITMTYLLEGFKKGYSLDYILMWNSIRNEYNRNEYK